jgi:hypothetical protein
MHGRRCGRPRAFCRCYDLSSSNLKRTSENFVTNIFQVDIPINETLDDGHLCLLELLLGVSSCGVRQVDGMTNLDVIRERNIFHFNTVGTRNSRSASFAMETKYANSCVSHLPKSLTSWPSLEISFGRVVVAILLVCVQKERPQACVDMILKSEDNDEHGGLSLRSLNICTCCNTKCKFGASDKPGNLYSGINRDADAEEHPRV